MRRRQSLAIVAGVMLLALHVAPHLPQALPSVEASGPGAAPSVSAVMTHLLVRNPRLGPARAARIAGAVLRCTEGQGLPELTPKVVLAVMFKESDARPQVQSPKGAVGLMQVMPHMFEVLDMPGGIAHLELNVEAGCILLADNIRRLGYARGVSAYFWGSNIRGTQYLQRVNGILEGLDDDPLESIAADRG